MTNRFYDGERVAERTAIATGNSRVGTQRAAAHSFNEDGMSFRIVLPGTSVAIKVSLTVHYPCIVALSEPRNTLCTRLGLRG